MTRGPEAWGYIRTCAVVWMLTSVLQETTISVTYAQTQSTVPTERQSEPTACTELGRSESHDGGTYASATQPVPSSIDFPAGLPEAKVLYRRSVEGDVHAGEQAVIAFSQLAQQYPNNAIIRAYLGSVRLLEARQTWGWWRKYRLGQEGLRLLDAAVALAPQDLEVRVLRGITTFHLPQAAARSEQAATDLQWAALQAAEAVKEGQLEAALAAATLYYHGLCRIARADIEGAKRAWHCARMLAPQSSAAQRASARLHSLATGHKGKE